MLFGGLGTHCPLLVLPERAEQVPIRVPMSLIGEEEPDVREDRETSRLDTCHAGIPTTVPGCFQVSEQGRGLQPQLDTERHEDR